MIRKDKNYIFLLSWEGKRQKTKKRTFFAAFLNIMNFKLKKKKIWDDEKFKFPAVSVQLNSTCFVGIPERSSTPRPVPP